MYMTHLQYFLLLLLDFTTASYNCLSKQVIPPTAHHLDGTLEYNVHNLYGHASAMATWRALTNIYPERRPFVLTRYIRDNMALYIRYRTQGM